MGSGCCKETIPPSAHSKRKPVPVEIIESFVVVWLDPSIDSNPSSNEIKEQLEKLVDVVITYTDPEECYTYIKSVKNEKIFLIVSNTLVEHFVPRVQTCSQIDSIYRFCQNDPINKNLTDKFLGVRGSHKVIGTLCKQLEDDIKICDYNMVAYEFVEESSLDTITDSNQDTESNEYERESSFHSSIEHDQNMEDNESVGESSLDMSIRIDRNMEDDELMTESRSEIASKKHSHTRDNESTKESSSKIASRKHSHVGDDELIEEPFSKTTSRNHLHAEDDKSVKGSSSKTALKKHSYSKGTKSTKGFFSKIASNKQSHVKNDESLEESFPKTAQKSKLQGASFIYDQLFREIVSTVKGDNMKDIYKFYRRHYKNKPEKLEFLNKLQSDYSSARAIFWYSEDAFLYRIVNRALRLHEYDRLYVLRGFIRDLHTQIVTQQKGNPQGITRLYRGQGMGQAELDDICLREGKLLYIPNFWSTTFSREVALRFLERNRGKPNIKCVLTEIDVDKNIPAIFADIHEQSKFPEEQECLFSMGSVFRIGPTTESEDTWYIHLTLANDSNTQRIILKEHFKNSIEDDNVCLSFARITHQLEDLELSKHFYLKSLKQEDKWHRQAAIYNNLGLIALEQRRYKEAQNNYKKSLQIEQEQGDSEHRDLASTYNNMGTLHYKQNKVALASKYFQRAVEAHNETLNGNQEIMATIYSNIATVLNYEGNYQQALEYNEKCLNIRINIFPDLHPSLATTYNNIASTLHHVQKFAQAVEYAEKAFDIDIQTLGPNHRQTRIHKENLEIFRKEKANLEN